MKKLIGFVVILAAAGGGWWYYIKYGKPPEKPQVTQATISKGDIVEQVTSTGTLEPERRFDVGSQVSGTVKAIHVDYNDLVKEGQLLAEIDPSLLMTQVDIRKAAISRQESDILNQLVQLEDQERQLDRTRNLVTKGLQNQQALEAAELGVKTRKAQIESARKSLVQAGADLALAEMNVSYTKIKAPADGVVVERRVDVGQTVQASMTTPQFFVLARPLVNLRLTAQVDEADIGRIRPGMEVRFTVEAYGQQQFSGAVDAVRLNATVANNVVTYPVWISVPNQDLKLRPSMTASLRIIISTAEDVIRVPNQALRFRPNTDIWKALGIEPPAPGSGGRPGGPGGNTDEAKNNSTNPPGTATPGTNAQAGGSTRTPGQGGDRSQAGNGGDRQAGGQNRQPGQGAQGGGQGGNQSRTSSRGFGQGSDLANMTPEQRKELMDRFARGGGAGGSGRGGGGRGGNQNQSGRGGNAGNAGRGQNAGNRGETPAPAVPTQRQREADKIDELWAPVMPTRSRSSVYIWNEAAPVQERLKQVQVQLGVTDGSFSELLVGELKVGDQVVTGVVLPLSLRPNTQTNPLFGGQQNRMPGMGGMTPGGGGNPGGGGGGNPGGGGGGGRGGGGGGRGGGN